MVFVYGALMFLALAGMIVCSKKQKTNPAMQPIAFVLFACARAPFGRVLRSLASQRL